MGRIIGLCAALLCLGALQGATPAAAQCGESCTTVVDAELKVIGYGCVFNSDSPTRCTATAYSCMANPCGNFGFILDAKGSAVAQARLCSGRVRGVESITVVPARAPSTLAALGGALSQAAPPTKRTE